MIQGSKWKNNAQPPKSMVEHLETIGYPISLRLWRCNVPCGYDALDILSVLAAMTPSTLMIVDAFLLFGLGFCQQEIFHDIPMWILGLFHRLWCTWYSQCSGRNDPINIDDRWCISAVWAGILPAGDISWYSNVDIRNISQHFTGVACEKRRGS